MQSETDNTETDVTIPEAAELPEEKLKEIGEVISLFVRTKTVMLKEGLTSFQTECPRCGHILHAAIAGRKKHLRMACEGHCGMSILE